MDSLPPDPAPPEPDPPAGDDDASSGGLPTWAEGTGPVALSGRWDSMAALDGLAEAGAVPADETERYARGPVLGQGGMGTVYLAEDQRLRRQVAIKEARGGAGEARLLAEARIIAALDHPGIVPIYDTGVDADGRPWYAMRVVRGRTLARAIAEAADLDGRLRLLRPFLGACEAVAYAHDRGLVHRDLKPDNVIVGAYGEAQVMDWGLARPVDTGSAAWAAVLDAAGPSTGGLVIGTPAYMSPEQAGGDPVGPRGDVWSLGVCLYELVTGQRPFSGDSPMDVVARVRTEPVPDPRASVPEAPAELCAIIAKATARDPDDRYADAAALSHDLEAFLDGRRVAAHRYTALAELRRALVRWRRTLVAVGVVGAVAVAFLAQAWWVALGERDRAVQAQEELRAEQALSQENLAAALVAQAVAAADQGARGEAETLAAHALTLRESPEARGLLMQGGARPRRVLAMPVPTGCTERRLSGDGALLACRRDGRVTLYETAEMQERWSRDLGVEGLSFSGTGQLYLADIDEGRQIPVDMATGRPRLDLPPLRALEHAVVYGRDAEHVTLSTSNGWHSYLAATHARTHPGGAEADQHSLYTLPGGRLLKADDEAIVLLDLAGGVLRRHVLPPELSAPAEAVLSLEPSPDEAELLLGTLHGQVARLDLETGRVLASRMVSEGAVEQVLWSPDGRHAAARDSNGRVSVWTIGGGGVRVRLPGRADVVRFDAQGQLVVLGAELSRWALAAAGAEAVRPTGAGVSNLDWRGDTLAAAVGDGRVLLWRSDVLDDVRVIDGQVVKDVALGPPGEHNAPRFAAASMLPDPSSPRLGDVRLPVPQADHVLLPGCRRAIFAGAHLLCNPSTDGPWIFDADGGVVDPGSHGISLLIDAEPDPARERAILLSYAGEVLRFDPAAPAPLRQVLEQDGGRAVALGEGTRFVLGREQDVQLRGLDGTVHWTAPTVGRARDVAISERAGLVAAGQVDGRTRLWRITDGSLAAVLSGHRERSQAVVFSPGGTQLATGSWDATVRLWDLAVLDRPAEALLAEVEAAWGLSLEEALASASGG